MGVYPAAKSTSTGTVVVKPIFFHLLILLNMDKKGH
jgi:hypothetical protein